MEIEYEPTIILSPGARVGGPALPLLLLLTAALAAALVAAILALAAARHAHGAREAAPARADGPGARGADSALPEAA